MLKIFKDISVLSLALLAHVNTVQASKESVEACVTAVEVLNENIELQTAFTSMLQGYNETCVSEGLCTIDIDEDTLFELKNMDASDKDAQLPAIKGKAVGHFGKNFKNHLSFLAYDTACTDAGGTLDCIDGHFTLLGTAGAAFLKNEEGVDTDVEVTMKSFPICLPAECDGEELDKVFENAAKDAFLKAPAIAEEMTAQSEAMVKSVTMEQVCALSGLDTCDLDVKSVGCEMDSPASMSSSSRLLSAFVLVGAALFSLM